jgi:hypothetical protein
MNQTPTRNQNPIQDNQLIQIRQGGFDESNPYMRRTRTEAKPNPYSLLIYSIRWV